MAFMGAQPGTRITGKLDERSNLWTYVKQAFVGAIALDVFVLLVMLTGLLIGWLSVPLTLAITGLGIALGIVWIWHPEQDFMRLIVGNLWGACLLVGLARGQHIWQWFLVAPFDQVWQSIVKASPLPMWAYLLFPLLWLTVYALKRPWPIVFFSLFSIGVLGYTLSHFDDWEIVRFGWSRLRYVLIPYLPPWMFFAIILGIVMAKEMLFPNLEHTLRPVSLEELREIGLVGLWMPRLFGNTKEEPIAKRLLEYQVKDTEGNLKISMLPDSKEFFDFVHAVHRGDSFTIRTAKRWGLSRGTYNKVRQIFFDRGWADWGNPKNHNDGVKLYQEGYDAIEGLALSGGGE